MSCIANGLLAIGASPLMSISTQESEDLMKITDAVYINIGTLDAAFLDHCHCSIAYAKKHHIPVIVDPVGAGASHLRTDAAKALIASAAVIKGNASEIMALTQDAICTMGTETQHDVALAIPSAISLARQYQVIVAVSGATDFVTDGKRHYNVFHGDVMMTYVTGMGCLLTAIIASFVSSQIAGCLETVCHAIAYYNICGTIAAKSAQGPSQFIQQFIDTLYQGIPEQFEHLQPFKSIEYPGFPEVQYD